MNILLMIDKLIIGGVENYFCKLENNLYYEDFKIYIVVGDGELYEFFIRKENFILFS